MEWQAWNIDAVVQDRSKEVHRESEVLRRWDDEKDSEDIDGNIVGWYVR